MNTLFTARIGRFLAVTTLFVSSVLLSGCGGGGDSTPVPNANLTGFYTGNATVNTDGTSTPLTDLQILANGNRIMVMSASAAVLYDATVTAITGNSYTANVTVYENGLYTQSITLSGTVNPGSSISGTFSGGTGLASGNFSNVMVVTGQPVATLAQVTGDWTGDSNGNTNVADNFQLSLDSSGMVPVLLSFVSIVTGDIFQDCSVERDNPTVVLTSVANTSLYTVNLILTTSCRSGSAEGNHTGLATLRTDGTLVMMFANITHLYLIVTPDVFGETFAASGIVELRHPPL